MNEIKEVLRLWLGGIPKKRIAAQLSLDPKTVRRYVAVAETSGLAVPHGPSALTDERLTEVLLALHPTRGRPHGTSWASCVAQHAALEKHLAHGLRLTKIRRLLKRRGVDVPYPTLHRYAVEHLQFGRAAPTVLVAALAHGQDAPFQGVGLHRRGLPSDPFEASDTVHTKDSLAKPALVVGLPLVLGRTEAAKALGPERKARTEIRQGSCRHTLHLFDRIQERPRVR